MSSRQTPRGKLALSPLPLVYSPFKFWNSSLNHSELGLISTFGLFLEALCLILSVAFILFWLMMVTIILSSLREGKVVVTGNNSAKTSGTHDEPLCSPAPCELNKFAGRFKLPKLSCILWMSWFLLFKKSRCMIFYKKIVFYRTHVWNNCCTLPTTSHISPTRPRTSHFL
jgi:hypothetical protein